ncbi:MAG: hypothetical protein NVSMB19_16570 [Vulcanimicrobiaceae bacterium]
MTRQRGFTIPEVLIAIVLFLALAIATLGTTRGLTRVLDGRSTAQNGVLSMEREIARMRSDADTAFAVFVPQNDVMGRPNVGTAQGAPHEVDFYSKTETGAETWWAYHFDRARGTLQRYDYDPASGARGVFDRTTGAIDRNGQYPAVTGVRSFTAASVQANDLADVKHNALAPLLAGLTRGATPRADPVGFVPANGTPRDDLYGGNASVHVALQTDHGSRTLHLVSGAMASGFTIHAALAMRSFIYRIDSIHRSWFGFAQKTKAHIYEQLQYSFTPANPASWKLWCDFEVYGHGANGLTLNDPHASYQPYEFASTTGSNFFIVTHDGVRGQDPVGGCRPAFPTPNDTPAPVSPGNYDTYETPPPCFAAGQCWPYGAPPNFAPPSPWPANSPPADWCAGHQASPLCGGTGAGPTPAPVAGPLPPPDVRAPLPPPPGGPGVPAPGSTRAPIGGGRVIVP